MQPMVQTCHYNGHGSLHGRVSHTATAIALAAVEANSALCPLRIAPCSVNFRLFNKFFMRVYKIGGGKEGFRHLFLTK